VDEIEVTSFVSPKWVPQLGDAAEVLAGIRGFMRDDFPSCMLSALSPNEKGVSLWKSAEDAAREARPPRTELQEFFSHFLIAKIAFFTAASETFCKKNTNATISESLERLRQMAKTGLALAPVKVRGYISCAIACPFEGPIHPTKVADIASALVEAGVHEVDLGDTIGAGDWDSTTRMLEAVRDRIGDGWFERGAVTLHLHDTFGRAAECVHAALDLGVRSFDGSVAGLGGCPYASKKLPDGTIQRAPGNISTELLVQTIHDAGYRTNVDLDKLREAAAFAREIVAKSRAGSVSGGGSGGAPA
jgi:hydroxymethylglutaryl-CoA lyase